MMTRVNAAALLLLASVPSLVAAADDEFYGSRDLGFFGFFASKENQHGFAGRLECEYGHPVKGKMCPPVMKDPMASAKATKDESVLETFSRCLDDPDLPECRELQAGEVTPAAQVATAPAHLRNLFGATVSPTVDDCGGNMFDVSIAGVCAVHGGKCFRNPWTDSHPRVRFTMGSLSMTRLTS